jgi:hypothetical protein
MAASSLPGKLSHASTLTFTFEMTGVCKIAPFSNIEVLSVMTLLQPVL